MVLVVDERVGVGVVVVVVLGVGVVVDVVGMVRVQPTGSPDLEQMHWARSDGFTESQLPPMMLVVVVVVVVVVGAEVDDQEVVEVRVLLQPVGRPYERQEHSARYAGSTEPQPPGYTVEVVEVVDDVRVERPGVVVDVAVLDFME
jgi:hypothetical protein